MRNLLLRLLINALALAAAAYVVPGVSRGSWVDLLLVALVFGVVNAIIGPLLKFMTCPLILLTLGLFLLVINALLLLITSWAGSLFGLGFSVNGFTAAFFGGLVVSIVSCLLSVALGDLKKDRKKK